MKGVVCAQGFLFADKKLFLRLVLEQIKIFHSPSGSCLLPYFIYLGTLLLKCSCSQFLVCEWIGDVPALDCSQAGYPGRHLHILSDLTFSLALPNRELDKDVVHCPSAGFGKLPVQWRQLSNEKICIKQAKNTCGEKILCETGTLFLWLFSGCHCYLFYYRLLGWRPVEVHQGVYLTQTFVPGFYLVSGTAEEVPWNRCSSVIPCWGRILEICHNYSV